MILTSGVSRRSDIFSFCIVGVFLLISSTDLWFRLSLLQSIPGGGFDSSRCCSPLPQLPAGPLARCGSGRVRLYRRDAWSRRKKTAEESGDAFKIKASTAIPGYFHTLQTQTLGKRWEELLHEHSWYVSYVLNYFGWQMYGEVTGGDWIKKAG